MTDEPMIPLLPVTKVGKVEVVTEVDTDKPVLLVNLFDEDGDRFVLAIPPGWSHHLATELFVNGWRSQGTPEGDLAAEAFAAAWTKAIVD